MLQHLTSCVFPNWPFHLGIYFDVWLLLSNLKVMCFLWIFGNCMWTFIKMTKKWDQTYLPIEYQHILIGEKSSLCRLYPFLRILYYQSPLRWYSLIFLASAIELLTWRLSTVIYPPKVLGKGGKFFCNCYVFTCLVCFMILFHEWYG